MGSRFSGNNSAYKNSHLIVAGKGNFSRVINPPEVLPLQWQLLQGIL
jgi:hypothetical protein